MIRLLAPTLVGPITGKPKLEADILPIKVIIFFIFHFSSKIPFHFPLKLSPFLSLLLLLSSCQPKGDGQSWHVKGTAEGLTNGDMLLLTDADGQLLDSIRVSNGKFSCMGKTDSVCLYSIYVAKDETKSVCFLTEPGNIKVTLAAKPGESKVGGTAANDALQELTESLNPYYERLEKLEQALFQDTTRNAEKEWALMERYAQIAHEIEQKIREADERFLIFGFSISDLMSGSTARTERTDSVP